MAKTRSAAGSGTTLTLRLEVDNRPGMLGRVTTAIGRVGGSIGAVDLVEVRRGIVVRDLSVALADGSRRPALESALRAIRGVRIVNVSDRVFLVHLGGKIEVTNKRALKTRDDLSMAYTPGVARVSLAIRDHPDSVHALTIKKNCVAVVTDGSAVLGLGDIGPEASLPVMEGKAMLFKEFGGVDAFPICIRERDPEQFVRIVAALEPVFGGINLEDIAAPRCFEIEDKLRERVRIPVFHDDQHGTAVVVLAALINSLKVVRKRLARVRIVINGAGAAGIAVAKILLSAGAKRIVLCDTQGVISADRGDLNPAKAAIALVTNRERLRGGLERAVRGADVFIGVSAAGALKPRWAARMNRNAVIFGLANPTPEIMPEEAMKLRNVRVVATGRSDYPNQINNVLCFPGFFRGLLDCRATGVNEAMKLAAARALAAVVTPRELHADYVVPSVFNRKVGRVVARAVGKAAVAAGLARRITEPRPD